jgi:hypothetical protein
MPVGELLLAFGQADEAGEIGVQDCGKAASGAGHKIPGMKSSWWQDADPV